MTQTGGGVHLVLLILASIFFAFSAFGSWLGPPNSTLFYTRLNWIGLGLFFWSLAWFF